MGDAFLICEVVYFSVILVCDFFSCPVSRRRNCRFTLAPADDFNAEMIDCDALTSLNFG